MPETWRGYTRPALLGRARLALEDQGVVDANVEMLDEMEDWSAQSLYQWLLENDGDFEAETRARVLARRAT